ncbi:ATP-binding cassette sub-family C member 5-like isoform X2 [Mercenaria mercenaria]|uniref:ATP-binding cassette sub-family C member 5-like isoform X2 n=1 Tax=Mercenaria mercenaria TaxID=6596 RepID=UPI00234F0FD3|nr:ATP-binding cassette sub-family C member 5-like isoform X2 [Mercenaria mercenaria]
MSSSRLARRRSSAGSLVIPESETDRRVSLTGYSNIVLDVSVNSQQQDEDKSKVRVRFAELPAVGLDMSGYGVDKPMKRKYSVALQTLKPFRPSSKDGKLPINKVGFFSYLFVTWLSPLVWKMFRNRSQPVAEGDIWECSDQEGVAANTERMVRLWNEEIEKRGEKKASFINVWIQFIRTRTLITLSILTLNALATFTSSAFLVNQVVGYLESTEDNIAFGLGLTAAMLGCEMIRAISFSTLMIFSAQTGTRFRSGFMGIMYDKLLKLRVVKGKTNSEIINIFSVDSYRVYMATWAVTFLISVPIYLIIGTVYCYTLIGYWCFVSIGTFVVCYFGQTLLTKFISTLRKQCAQYTDLRVRRMGEILNSMKFIKMYAWEKPFNDAIIDVRKSEQKYMLYSALLNAVIGSIIPVTPTIASVITITIYTAAGNNLTASTAFAVIGTMNFLRIIVALIPFSLRAYGEAKVSFARLKRLLLMEEHSIPSTEVFNKDNVVEIKAANFIWDIVLDQSSQLDAEKNKRKSSVTSLDLSRRESISNFALSDINLEVQQGKLIGICGAVGSGKSSLMSAVMGRMLLQKGHLAVNGDVAYVAQQAWIFNATLKENILFGREFDADRYKQVINCCGLEPDLRLLSDGDETEIGERGANLSGGQKQRVNLARAVYSHSDIFILDDPLSALDVKVGKQIFHTCIKSMLKDKTVLLVTHQLQYLKHCDEVVVMEEGCIEEKGQHQELLAMNGLYSNMFRIFDQTTMKSRKPESSGDGEPGSYIKHKGANAASTKPEENELKKNGILKPSKKRGKGKLVLTEEAAIGNIGFGTYNAYILAAGGWCVAFLVIFAYFVSAGSLVFSDWWLSEWISSLSLPSQPNNLQEGNTTTESTAYTASIGTTAQLPEGSESGMFSYDTYFTVYISSLAGIIVLQLFKSFIGAKASIVASNRLHAKCLDKVMKAPMSFFDSNPVGRILNRFSKDLDEGDVFIPQVTNSFLQIFTLVLLSVAMSAFITPWILIAIVPMVIVFYIMKQISTVSVRQLKRLENISRSPLISHVNVTSQGLPTIVAYRQQERFFEKCTGVGDVASMSIFLFDASMRWIGLRLDLMAGMMTVSTSLIFVLTKGLIPPASAGLVLGLCGKTVSIVQFLVRLMNETEARFTSVERLHEYNTTLSSEAQHAKKFAKPDWPENGSVSFHNVVMRYRPDMDPVLSSVNFVISPREKVGIVGRTGAGKSSLAAALFRLVELGAGSIVIDGEDISALHLSTIRSKMSTITQEPVLFAGTIRYNIDPFSLYSDDSIWEALDKVHIKEKIVQFDEGLEVIVEENGENFSVGERQLICLARAVLRSSKILLLDEATANIDTSTDAMIQETIRECFSDCTVITIAHRLNTVLHSDKIIVLDSGQVMECASPQDLLSNPHSFFNSMISAQSVKTPSP